MTHRILIVEDSPTMRQLLVFALRRMKNVEIVEAVDGMDGLRKISSDHFDGIVFAERRMALLNVVCTIAWGFRSRRFGLRVLGIRRLRV